ncbi:MAG: hypothetical protein J1E02_07680 [Coprobacter sp.]|nr:hypothetical protein [Coprobacter sp.]
MKPAYTAIIDIVEEKEEAGESDDYDLEETIRILNSLEVAQTQSESFDDFLLYMAKQDYSRVAPEVLRAKAKFFPVLQRMYELQKEYKEFSTLWMFARSIAAGGNALRENMSVSGVGLAILSNGVAGEAVSVDAVNTATNAMFDNYAKEQKLKKALKKQIQQVKEQYIRYLSDFAPVYYKYMKEWDKLCLNKDKAYIDIYSGRADEALGSINAVLKQSPENREGLLLKSLCLIDLGKMNEERHVQFYLPLDMEHIKVDSLYTPQSENLYYEAASLTLRDYLELYPGKSAPALLLQGMLAMNMGNPKAAMSCFEQSAIEYPRQAEELTDLLSSYRSRTYLNKSVEGLYLLNLYKSTMEGFGRFSPNFCKAQYYTSIGDFNSSREEILKHFYRRGNQGVYDCLLSDMDFCEDFLYSSFSPIAPEKSFIDVSIAPAKKYLVMDKENEITVKLNNRSDHDLENVRVFLCIHYTDMYKDDYHVVKVPMTKNRIGRHEKADLSTVKLEYNDKKVDDITRVRAIVMTDDKICWVDEVKEKERKIIDSFAARYSNTNVVDNARQDYLSDLSIDVSSLQKVIEAETRINGKTSILLGSDLKIELPRILTFIDPEFSLYPIQDKDLSRKPNECFLAGSYINLKFDNCSISAGKTVPLYIYSDFVCFRLDLKSENGDVKLEKVEVVKNGTEA